MARQLTQPCPQAIRPQQPVTAADWNDAVDSISFHIHPPAALLFRNAGRSSPPAPRPASPSTPRSATPTPATTRRPTTAASPPRAGLYQVLVMGEMAPGATNGGAERYVAIIVNGTTIWSMDLAAPVGTTSFWGCAGIDIPLNAGDYVEAQLFQDSGIDENIPVLVTSAVPAARGVGGPLMTVRPVPTPQRVAVGQTGTAALWNGTFPPAADFLANRPYAYLTQTTVQTISNTAPNPVRFDGGYDSTGAAHSNTVNNSRYTCQLAGLYHVIAQMGFQPPLTSGYPYNDLAVMLNGGPTYGNRQLLCDSTGGLGGTGQLSIPIVLQLGDYIELIAYTGNSAPVLNWGGTKAPRMFVHWLST